MDVQLSSDKGGELMVKNESRDEYFFNIKRDANNGRPRRGCDWSGAVQWPKHMLVGHNSAC